MDERFERTKLLFGEEAIEKLQKSRVIVFGIGGVGGHCVEALVRSGVGCIDIVDNDTVAVSNINRQLIALTSTVGKSKVSVMYERLKDIAPDVKINCHECFYLPETADGFDFRSYDHVVDAIDTVTGKLSIIQRANEAGVPVISAMGAGNKLDPTKFEVADIYKTSVCPLAKVIRTECRKRGIKRLKVVYSKEMPVKPSESMEKPSQGKRSIPGSIAFVPSVAGLIMAAEVVKELIK